LSKGEWAVGKLLQVAGNTAQSKKPKAESEYKYSYIRQRADTRCKLQASTNVVVPETWNLVTGNRSLKT
jgi:hypothetical protein